MPVYKKQVFASIGGGGAAITYLAGAAGALDSVCDVKGWSGTSAGAIISAAKSFSVPDNLIKSTLKAMFSGKILRFDPDSIGRGGILDMSTIGDAIDEIIGKDATFGDAFKPLVVCATNLDRREPIYFSKKYTPRVKIREALIASSAFMGLITPSVTVPSLGSRLSPDIRLFSDGGYTDNTCDHAWLNEYDSRVAIRLKPDDEIRRVRQGDVIGIHSAVIGSLFFAQSQLKMNRYKDISIDLPFKNDWNFFKTHDQIEKEFEQGFGATIYQEFKR